MEKANSLLTKQDLLSETTFLVPQIEQITMVDFDEFVGKLNLNCVQQSTLKTFPQTIVQKKSRRILSHGWLKGSNWWN